MSEPAQRGQTPTDPWHYRGADGSGCDEAAHGKFADLAPGRR